MSETRINRAIAGAGVVLILLILAAVLNPLLASPQPPAAAVVTQVVSDDPVTDAALAHQAAATDVISAVHVQAAQAHAAVLAAQQAALAKAAAAAAAAPPAAPPAHMQSSGVLSCAAVESLWVNAGGPSSLAVLMAEIAGAESSRNPAAPGGGLFQIQGGQPIPGDLSNPVVNAENAVAKYRSQGLGAWTTYTSGAYRSHPC